MYVSLRDCRLAVPLKISRSNPMVPASNAAASVAEILGVTYVWQGRRTRPEIRVSKGQRRKGIDIGSSIEGQNVILDSACVLCAVGYHSKTREEMAVMRSTIVARIPLSLTHSLSQEREREEAYYAVRPG